MLAVEQQDLIAAVDERMNALGQHGGGAADRRGNELGDGDAEIGGQRAEEDDVLLEGMGLARPLRPVARPAHLRSGPP